MNSSHVERATPSHPFFPSSLPRPPPPPSHLASWLRPLLVNEAKTPVSCAVDLQQVSVYRSFISVGSSYVAESRTAITVLRRPRQLELIKAVTDSDEFVNQRCLIEGCRAGAWSCYRRSLGTGRIALPASNSVVPVPPAREGVGDRILSTGGQDGII